MHMAATRRLAKDSLWECMCPALDASHSDSCWYVLTIGFQSIGQAHDMSHEANAWRAATMVKLSDLRRTVNAAWSTTARH